MSHIQWDEKYSVHIEVIDEQHKKITELLDILFDAISTHRTQEVLAGVVKEIVDYTGYHFSTEESLMTRYDYPDYIEHKKEHDAFKVKAIQLQKEAEEGKPRLSLAVVKLLTNWLDHHIMEVDKRYGPFLNEKGIF